MWGFRYFDGIYNLKDEFYQKDGERGFGEIRCQAVLTELQFLTDISIRSTRYPLWTITRSRKIPAGMYPIILSMGNEAAPRRRFEPKGRSSLLLRMAERKLLCELQQVSPPLPAVM